MLGHIKKYLSSCNRFCLPSKTRLPPPVINGHNQAGWENTHPFYILFQVLKVRKNL